MEKDISTRLAFGILFVPMIFAWFTLKKGHSTISRAVSFGWLALMIIIMLTADQSSNALGQLLGYGVILLIVGFGIRKFKRAASSQTHKPKYTPEPSSKQASNSPDKAVANHQASRRSTAFQVCFTGFNSDERNHLEDFADASGLIVRKDVTKNLNILCCGDNAGPSKLKRAREKGCLILNRKEFEIMLETGEVPEDV